VEIAERGPNVFLNHILSILNFMINYIDMATVKAINQDILRLSAKFIDSPAWKESLKILKLVVSRSSSLATPSYSASTNYSSSIISSIVGTYDSSTGGSMGTFADSDFGPGKRELPGRTMDFRYDYKESPIVGLEFIQKRAQMCQVKREMDGGQETGSGKNALETLFDSQDGQR